MLRDRKCRAGLTNEGLFALSLATFVCLMAFPASVSAQSGIAGVVRDTSGGVLPGVTVEAESPALIEKVRTVQTDDQGRYNVVDVRPGTYTVTFTLAGFTTVRREGIELPAAFTATVDGQLGVGGVEETVTVTGAAPLVDVQGTSVGSVVSQEVLSATPAGARIIQRYTVFVPGVQSSNEGGSSRGLAAESGNLAIHGGRTGEAQLSLEGVATRNMNGPGGSFSARWQINPGMVQEVAISLGAAGADQQMGGIVTNAIPKSGGNRFTGTTYFHYANESFSATNLTDELKALNLGAAGGLRETWDINPAIGGPLREDKLWFYTSFRDWGNEYDGGVRYNLTPQGWAYTPDMSRPTASQRFFDQNYSVRLTAQVTPRNTVSFFADHNPRRWTNRQITPNVAPEATQWTQFLPNRLFQATWKSPVNSRLYLEANWLYQMSNTLLDPSNDPEIFKGAQPANPAVLNPAIELSTNVAFRATSSNYGNLGFAKNLRGATALSYVTGSHTFKTGMEFLNGSRYENQYRPGDMRIQLRNARPDSLILFAPRDNVDTVKADLGLYVQDRWTVGRLAVNGGVRFDYLNAQSEAHTTPGNRWLPTRTYDAVKGVPIWKDLTPRMGAAYDLFGDGKTAIKMTMNRYVEGAATEIATANNPVVTSVQSASRTWTDDGRNGGINADFVPQCDFNNLDANGECGSISDRNFGQSNPRATRWDPDVLKGWGKRGHQWETSLQFQHQLRPGISTNVGYYRRTFSDFRVTQNTALGDNPSIHYDQYCVTPPVDPKLPDGGGKQICGYYDIKPAMRGVVTSFITNEAKFGERKEAYNGFDLTMSARFARGQVSGGMNTGKTNLNTCFIVNSPQDLLFCDRRPPFQTQVKFTAIYELPWYGVQLAGNFRNLPGDEIVTTYVATNAEVAPTLGRPLSAGATSTVTVPIAPAGSLYEARWSQTDIRASKIFTIARFKLMGSLDVFNISNSAGTLSSNARYGPQYLVPTSLVSPRLYRLAVSLDF